MNYAREVFSAPNEEAGVAGLLLARRHVILGAISDIGVPRRSAFQRQEPGNAAQAGKHDHHVHAPCIRHVYRDTICLTRMTLLPLLETLREPSAEFSTAGFAQHEGQHPAPIVCQLCEYLRFHALIHPRREGVLRLAAGAGFADTKLYS